MKHTISLLVENKFGVLARIAGLFSARGYNITSLAVSEGLDPTISYMTIIVDAEDEKILEQINKQLNKLIDVITVTDFTKKEYIDREMILVKIECSPKEKAKIEGLLRKYAGRIIHAKGADIIIEAVGDHAQIKVLLEGLSKFGVKELARTGRLAVEY